jgi:hypothetical protein
MTLFCTRAIFSGATSRPRLPRLSTMPSAAVRMSSNSCSAEASSTCLHIAGQQRVGSARLFAGWT